MDLGMIGLGRMGGNMAQRLLAGGHKVVAFDANAEAVVASRSHGALGAGSLEEWLVWRRPGQSGSWCPPALRPMRLSTV